MHCPSVPDADRVTPRVARSVTAHRRPRRSPRIPESRSWREGDGRPCSRGRRSRPCYAPWSAACRSKDAPPWSRMAADVSPRCMGPPRRSRQAASLPPHQRPTRRTRPALALTSCMAVESVTQLPRASLRMSYQRPCSCPTSRFQCSSRGLITCVRNTARSLMPVRQICSLRVS